MSILNAIDIDGEDTEDGQPYQEWFETVQGDDWFLTKGSNAGLHAGSLYGEFGFFCFFDTQEI